MDQYSIDVDGQIYIPPHWIFPLNFIGKRFFHELKTWRRVFYSPLFQTRWQFSIIRPIQYSQNGGLHNRHRLSLETRVSYSASSPHFFFDIWSLQESPIDWRCLNVCVLFDRTMSSSAKGGKRGTHQFSLKCSADQSFKAQMSTQIFFVDKRSK